MDPIRRIEAIESLVNLLSKDLSLLKEELKKKGPAETRMPSRREHIEAMAAEMLIRRKKLDRKAADKLLAAEKVRKTPKSNG